MDKIFGKPFRFELSCGGTLFISLFLNGILFILYEAKRCQQTILATNFHLRFHKLLEIYQIIKEILTRVLPIMILIISNLVICLKVKRSHQNSKKNESISVSVHHSRSKTRKKSFQERQLTNMSIFVAVLYVSTTVPMIFAFPGLLFKDTSTPVYKTYAALSNILELVQCSFRFAIYVCFTRKFRDRLLCLFSEKKYSSLTQKRRDMTTRNVD